MLTPSLLMHLTVDASIKANPTVTGGARSAPVVQFTLKVSPVDSLNPELVAKYVIEAPSQKKVSYAYVSNTITTGMYLSIGTKDYPISGLSSYPDDGKFFYEMILDDVRGA